MKKDLNLNNPDSEPEHAPLTVECEVHFDMHSAVPKGKLERWLVSLPEPARVSFEGMRSGKVYFAARWTEER